MAPRNLMAVGPAIMSFVAVLVCPSHRTKPEDRGKKRDTDRNRVRELSRWNNGQSQHFYSVQRIIQSSSRIDSRIRRELSETLYYYYPLVA